MPFSSQEKSVQMSISKANEDAVQERLHRIAAEKNPSDTVTSICRKVYGCDGQQTVEVDAAATLVSFRRPVAACICG